jgi:hypothetical protein
MAVRLQNLSREGMDVVVLLHYQNRVDLGRIALRGGKIGSSPTGQHIRHLALLIGIDGTSREIPSRGIRITFTSSGDRPIRIELMDEIGLY